MSELNKLIGAVAAAVVLLVGNVASAAPATAVVVTPNGIASIPVPLAIAVIAAPAIVKATKKCRARGLKVTCR